MTGILAMSGAHADEDPLGGAPHRPLFPRVPLSARAGECALIAPLAIAQLDWRSCVALSGASRPWRRHAPPRAAAARRARGGRDGGAAA